MSDKWKKCGLFRLRDSEILTVSKHYKLTRFQACVYLIKVGREAIKKHVEEISNA